jgi:hypothetical protein
MPADYQKSMHEKKKTAESLPIWQDSAAFL